VPLVCRCGATPWGCLGRRATVLVGKQTCTCCGALCWLLLRSLPLAIRPSQLFPIPLHFYAGADGGCAAGCDAAGQRGRRRAHPLLRSAGCGHSWVCLCVWQLECHLSPPHVGVDGRFCNDLKLKQRSRRGLHLPADVHKPPELVPLGLPPPFPALLTLTAEFDNRALSEQANLQAEYGRLRQNKVPTAFCSLCQVRLGVQPPCCKSSTGAEYLCPTEHTVLLSCKDPAALCSHTPLPSSCLNRCRTC